LITIWLCRRRYRFTLWIRRNLRIVLWSISAFTPAVILSLRASWVLGTLTYIAILVALAKLLVEQRDAEELVELSEGIPIVGGIIKCVSRAVVEVLW